MGDAKIRQDSQLVQSAVSLSGPQRNMIQFSVSASSPDSTVSSTATEGHRVTLGSAVSVLSLNRDSNKPFVVPFTAWPYARFSFYCHVIPAKRCESQGWNVRWDRFCMAIDLFFSPTGWKEMKWQTKDEQVKEEGKTDERHRIQEGKLGACI